MVVLAIDPGLERVGYAVVRKEGSRMVALAYGLISTPKGELPLRLAKIRAEMTQLIEAHQPSEIATERLLFTKNTTTAMDVAKALGVVLVTTADKELPWREYSPPEIKRTVVGNGRADKAQVTFMVTKILGLAAPPKPDDVADALAIAITHCLMNQGQGRLPGAPRS
ncbi:MAG: crossover junction endodeoxyribonuclease RuvC [Fimbriimonadaceae bacterium]|jgi:crossover junction endodeoxyribonuclease RuvC|nr:crossover junction endodeoxyribonuclease RuvC [Fimbriimonadaceae bacterium]